MSGGLEKRICRWLLFARQNIDNPWRVWGQAGRLGLRRRDVDSYLIKKGYNPFERGPT
jgi:hypothetical protein